MTERIFFDFDKSVLKPEAQALLKKKADWMKSNSGTKLLIEGNTDERGTAEYNLALGERRAESAKKFLVDLGIDAKRISTISYGEERPLDPRSNKEAWAKNRNDGFVVN
jgi:peptidoglycan-associated lipoprotein